MAFAETTNPDIVNQFAPTSVANPAELQRRAAAAWERISKTPRKPVYYEPQWEDPGLHGSAKQVSLRGARLASSKIGRGRVVMPARSSSALPPLPSQGMSTGEIVLISAAVLGAGALAWYLWKRKPAAPTAHVGELEVDDGCGLDMLGAE